MEKLLDYHWPGNIRHLDNVIKRAAILAEEGVIDEFHIIPERRRIKITGESSTKEEDGSHPEREEGFGARPIRSLAEVEKEAIEVALSQTSMNVSQAARALGITRVTLYKKAKVYGIGINR